MIGPVRTRLDWQTVRTSTAGRRIRRVAGSIERAVFPEAATAGDQWQRVVMDRTINEHLRSLGPSTLSAIEISGRAHEAKGWARFTSLDYPAFDLCAPDPRDEPADVVICEQVLEHVVDPWLAASNLRTLTKTGGHVVVSTPFLIKVHELPRFGMKDYWRFTPRGLRLLLESAGLVVDTVDTWGNRSCVVGNLDRWSARRPWHSLRNKQDMPVVVWAFARNPG